MFLTNEQKTVLKTIFALGDGDRTVPVTIGTIHHSFSDMDVSVLVRHLGILLDNGQCPAHDGTDKQHVRDNTRRNSV